MDNFLFYLTEGIRHIFDPEGPDHLLFIVSFCLPYGLRDWKRLAGLVTAFTVGHSLSLLLSVFEIVRIDQALVETLIPLSILLSCLFNYLLFFRPRARTASVKIAYPLLLAFGLLHGLGFSDYLRMMLFADDSIVLPVLGFNLSIEVAQLVIVGVVLFVFGALLGRFPQRQRVVLSGVNTLVILLVIGMMRG